MNLTKYLSDSIDQIFREAVRASFGCAAERKFLLQAAGVQKQAAEKRSSSEQNGTHIPPFLIASIATQCNLHCAGCYARANHACGDHADAAELTASRWGELFGEAKDLGVSFILLAGGEPLVRPDVLDEAAGVHGMIFPVFTNGTLLAGSMLDRFDQNRNLIPVVSVEGGRSRTDSRRGTGIYDLAARAMTEMGSRGIFFGASVTVTKENLEAVSSPGIHRRSQQKRMPPRLLHRVRSCRRKRRTGSRRDGTPASSQATENFAHSVPEHHLSLIPRRRKTAWRVPCFRARIFPH